MAGLHSALYLAEQGKKVVLIERNICGGSTTGKSAGFLTPDSELELSQLMRRYGNVNARKVWSIPAQGVDLIKAAVVKYGINCDFREQDSLFLGIGRTGRKEVLEESKSRKEFGFPFTLHDGKKVKGVNGGTYAAGVQYNNTYGINPLLYAQGLKNALVKLRVEVYESTEVTKIENNIAKTHLGSIKAKKIIVCIDKIN